MKKIFLLLLSVCGGVASAQTNAPATNAPTRPVIMDITSKSLDFDQNLRQAVYHGPVLVTDPQVRLTCELLTVAFPVKGRHLDQVQAETNVVIDFVEQGETYHITSAKGVYVYSMVNSVTNETVTFNGSPKPKVTWGDTNSLTGEPINSLTGDALYYTRVNGGKGSFHADNQQMHYEPPPAGTNTNTSPLKLF
jgi:lipopolysaccharide export system protein LptA